MAPETTSLPSAVKETHVRILDVFCTILVVPRTESQTPVDLGIVLPEGTSLESSTSATNRSWFPLANQLSAPRHCAGHLLTCKKHNFIH
jgi:hypothetical protein